MALPRFYLPPEQVRGKVLSLPEREVHHARDVLRVRTGQQVTLLDGRGNRFLCAVTKAERHTLEATLLSQKQLPPVPWQVTLLQAVTKTKSMEIIIQKATELGAARIVPLLSERVAVKLDPERPKPDKWRWIAIDAMKQCDGAWLPLIDHPISIGDYLARGEAFDLALLASLQSPRHPREFFQVFQSEHQHPPRSLAIWVGPEGDFTTAELAAIQASRAQPISLGPQVLRAETAALYTLSIVNYELQAGWKHPAPQTIAPTSDVP